MKSLITTIWYQLLSTKAPKNHMNHTQWTKDHFFPELTFPMQMEMFNKMPTNLSTKAPQSLFCFNRIRAERKTIEKTRLSQTYKSKYCANIVYTILGSIELHVRKSKESEFTMYETCFDWKYSLNFLVTGNSLTIVMLSRK